MPTMGTLLKVCSIGVPGREPHFLNCASMYPVASVSPLEAGRGLHTRPMRETLIVSIILAGLICFQPEDSAALVIKK